MSNPQVEVDSRIHTFWVTEQQKEEDGDKGAADKAVSSFNRDFTQETEKDKAS